ncbi:MAG: hypothetical protein V5A27_12260, partial [Halapricum sp.]
MNSQSDNKNGQTGQRLSEWGTTRRAVLAAGGAAALGALAGCSALDGLIDRGAGQLVGTTVSAPAAFYAGQAPTTDQDSDDDGLSDGDEPQFFVGGDTDVRAVPATVRAEGQEIDLEGWAVSTTTKAQGYNSMEPRLKMGSVPYAWWAGPDDDGDDDDVDEEALIEYLDDEPTIGERFTVCLPDAKLPGDRGSLAEELTLDRVLAYFAASHEPDGVRVPFNDRYDICCFDYNSDGCIQLDGPVSLHEDLACQNILSAKLDTYTTENRAIVGYGTEGGAVVSAAPASSDPIGKRVFLAKSDVTGEIILGEDRDMVMPGNDDTSSGSQTLVCPVTATPEDSPSPLPGLFFVRRIVHDDQIIFAGGWVLDDG